MHFLNGFSTIFIQQNQSTNFQPQPKWNKPNPRPRQRSPRRERPLALGTSRTTWRRRKGNWSSKAKATTLGRMARKTRGTTRCLPRRRFLLKVSFLLLLPLIRLGLLSFSLLSLYVSSQHVPMNLTGPLDSMSSKILLTNGILVEMSAGLLVITMYMYNLSLMPKEEVRKITLPSSSPHREYPDKDRRM